MPYHHDTLDLYQKPDKAISGNEGETANFGCAVKDGIITINNNNKKDPKTDEFDLFLTLSYPLQNITYDNIKESLELSNTEKSSLIGFDESSLKGGKWIINYTCKKPVEGNYTYGYAAKLGGDVLWTSPSATFEECKNKCDNYGDQCQQFELSAWNLNANGANVAPTFGHSSWDPTAKAKCSLTSSRNSISADDTSITYTKLKTGQTIICSDYSPKGRIDEYGYTKYRYMGDNKMRWYPNKDIGKSWDPNYDNPDWTTCIGYELGEDMKKKE
jgi:hypothetical protein